MTTDTPAPPATEPLWNQPPTPWLIADAWAEHIVDRLLAEIPELGSDYPGMERDGITVIYSTGGLPHVERMTICIHADLDGFLVNAFDDNRHAGFGPDLLPLEGGLGIRVQNTIHPRHGDPWFADTFPRLKAAVALAVEAITAVRDGNLCDAAAGIGKSVYPCRRPARHAGMHPQVWAEHANGAISWTGDRVTSSHPKAVVLR